MKKTKLIFIGLTLILSFLFAKVEAQDAYYKMSVDVILGASPTKDVSVKGTCWANAGTLFLETELLRLGNEKVALSELTFIHSMYIKKAEVYLKSSDDFRVNPLGRSFDVIALAAEFGMVPESEYLFPDDEMIGSNEKAGEMNAMIRGTLQMVKQNEGEQFTEHWQNMYSTSLMRYLGEPKRSFTYQQQMFTPISFVEKSSLILEDYVVVTSHPDKKSNGKVDLGVFSNWSDHKAYNVSHHDLSRIISGAINNDYSVLWYGSVDDAQIFRDENIAIVPAGSMPGTDADEQADELVFEPVAEMVITDELRRKTYDKNLGSEQTYLLLHGLVKDQNGKEYYAGKYACREGNIALTLSAPYVSLNTIYLLVNRNSLPDNLRKSMKL